MSIAPKTNASGTQLDSTVSSKSVPFVTATGDAVLVFVAVRSAVVTVLNVTDSAGNTYVKEASQLAFDVLQYQNGHYVAAPRNVDQVEVEVWTCIANSTPTSQITVTLTGGAKFAVDIQSYTGANATPATAFPHAYASLQTKTGTPSISEAITSTSYLAVGFGTWAPLNQAATAGTLRGSISAGTQGDLSPKAVELAVADATGATIVTVTLTPTNQITLEGNQATNNVALPLDTTEDQFINYGQILTAQPLTYGIVAVEVHV